jgi:sodium transport system ATP-binding protein
MIEIEGLRKRFVQGRGRRARVIDAVRGVTLRAADARITAVLGPNGAGKTTTLRMVAGLLQPDAGRIAVDGIDVVARPRDALARLGVLSDARGLYPRLSARENIAYHARLHGLTDCDAHARIEELARLLEFGGLLDRRTDGFSQGERMKTALARALVHDPPNIVLDEPTTGLDVQSIRGLRAALRGLRDEHGKCIVFCTHIMQEVERLCDHVVVVAHGRHVAEGSVEELCRLGGHDDFEQAFVSLAFSPEREAPAMP